MKKIHFLLLALLLQSPSSYAISEENYQKNYNNKVLPFLSSMKEGSFKGAEGANIHYRTLIRQKANNCLVILPGRTEPIEKYAEVVYDLKETPMGQNLNFYLMDHRGQGSSDRMSLILDMGHVDKFDNYVSDLATFISKMRLTENCDQKFLLAHSLGAGIAARYILDNPHAFDKVVFTSPMLQILTKPYPYPVAQAMVKSSVMRGKGAQFAPGQKGFNPALKFEDNTFTTSPERFRMTMDTFTRFPHTKVGGVSNLWLLEVMKATRDIRSRYNEFSVPMLVIHAGIEKYSDSDEMEKICKKAKNCKRVLLPESSHEVLMDKDVSRSLAMQELISFFNF